MNVKKKKLPNIYIILCLVLAGISISLFIFYYHNLWRDFVVMKGVLHFNGSFKEFIEKNAIIKTLRLTKRMDRYGRVYFASDMPKLVFGGLKFSTNSFGMRDKEVNFQKKSKNVYRILWLGASPTFIGSCDATTAPALLEKKLNTLQLNKKFEVINGGIFGAKIFNSFITFALNWRKLNSNLLIIDQGINDIALCKEDTLRMDKWISIKSPFGWLNIQFLKNRIGYLKQILIRYIGFSKATEPSEESLEAFKTKLEALILLAKGCGCKVILLSSQIVDEESFSQNRRKDIERFFNFHYPFNGFTKEGTLKTIKEINRIIEETASKYGVFFIDMSKAVPKDEKYFLDPTHRSDSGNEIFADVLMKKLFALGVLDK